MNAKQKKSACSSPGSGPRPGWPTWSSHALKPWPRWKKKDKLEQAKSLEFSFRSKPFKAKQVGFCGGSLLCLGAGRPLFEGLGVFHSGRGADLRRGQKRQGQDHPAQGDWPAPCPRQTGNISFNPQVESGVFEQTNIQSLVDSRTVEEELLYAQPDGGPPEGPQYLRFHDVRGRQCPEKDQRALRRRKKPGDAGQTAGDPGEPADAGRGPPTTWTWTACDALLAAIDNFDGAGHHGHSITRCFCTPWPTG